VVELNKTSEFSACQKWELCTVVELNQTSEFSVYQKLELCTVVDLNQTSEFLVYQKWELQISHAVIVIVVNKHKGEDLRTSCFCTKEFLVLYRVLTN
jgi:hypothetical protein